MRSDRTDANESTLSRRTLLALLPACAGASALAQEPPGPGGSPGSSPGGATQEARVPEAPRLVVLVRHGEKATDDPRDPSLSEAGLRRAEALVRLLGETRFSAAITSEFRRTRDFAVPLAKKHGLTPKTVPAKDQSALLAALQATTPGTATLLVGHSNTLPAVARALGATLSGLTPTGDFPDADYDRCVVLVLSRAGDPPGVLELRYG